MDGMLVHCTRYTRKLPGSLIGSLCANTLGIRYVVDTLLYTIHCYISPAPPTCLLLTKVMKNKHAPRM